MGSISDAGRVLTVLKLDVLNTDIYLYRYTHTDSIHSRKYGVIF